MIFINCFWKAGLLSFSVKQPVQIMSFIFSTAISPASLTIAASFPASFTFAAIPLTVFTADSPAVFMSLAVFIFSDTVLFLF